MQAEVQEWVIELLIFLKNKLDKMGIFIDQFIPIKVCTK